MPDPGGFKSARHFAPAGIDATSHSSGGKDRLGRISKMENPELRFLLPLQMPLQGRRRRADQ
ncbi:transposase [Bradyrhizobium sp. 145]|uniref:transposase n=1 Tax=Bradyrhizobium sp. 145 TaxID=2782621 RepID=UPI001FFA7005